MVTHDLVCLVLVTCSSRGEVQFKMPHLSRDGTIASKSFVLSLLLSSSTWHLLTVRERRGLQQHLWKDWV